MVPKKVGRDGRKRWRMCIDYRDLNSMTVADRYSLPRVDDCLNTLAGHKYFSAIDMTSGYYVCEIDEASRPYTAFRTPDGDLMQWRSLPFGLRNSPAHYMRMMNALFAGLTWRFMVLFVDDICIYSNTFDEHIEYLCQVFGRSREGNIYMNPTKAYLMRDSVDFLGHTVTRGEIKPQTRLVDKLKRLGVPNTEKVVREWLGLAQFLAQYIKDYAKNTKGLRSLLKLPGTKYDEKTVRRANIESEINLIIKTLESTGVLKIIDPGSHS